MPHEVSGLKAYPTIKLWLQDDLFVTLIRHATGAQLVVGAGDAKTYFSTNSLERCCNKGVKGHFMVRQVAPETPAILFSSYWGISHLSTKTLQL